MSRTLRLLLLWLLMAPQAASAERLWVPPGNCEGGRRIVSGAAGGLWEAGDGCNELAPETVLPIAYECRVCGVRVWGVEQVALTRGLPPGYDPEECRPVPEPSGLLGLAAGVGVLWWRSSLPNR